LLLAAGLSGCTLIDQRTFNPDAGKRPVLPKPPPPPAPPEPGPQALLTIRVPTTADLGGEVASAVAAARRRKPAVEFDVVEITPDAAAGAAAEMGEVARIIVAQGVPAARVHLSARPVPNAAREVRVYVR
jgi:hypothetical protein